MNMFLKLLALLKVLFPLPDFTNKASVQNWIEDLASDLAELLVSVLGQLTTTGKVTFDLPGGKSVVLTRGPDGTLDISQGDLGLLGADLRKGVAEETKKVGAWGDGTILKLLIELLVKFGPIVLPFFLTPKPTPTPEPPVV